MMTHQRTVERPKILEVAPRLTAYLEDFGYSLDWWPLTRY
jgi:hypothetical protein